MTRPDVCPDCHWGCESCCEWGRDAGRRETLWLMAVGAYWDWSFLQSRAIDADEDDRIRESDRLWHASKKSRANLRIALRALSDMGDETASRMLRGEV